MRTFLSRLRVVLLASIFIVLMTAFMVFPEGVADFANKLADQENTVRILMALCAVLADVLLALLIWRELQNARRDIKGLTVRAREANVEVSLESVRDALTTHISSLEDIFDVETAVRGTYGRVVITMGITARDKIDVRKKTAEIHREIVKIVEKQMGLRLANRPDLRFTLINEPTPEAEPKSRLGGFFNREKKEEPVPVFEAPAAPIKLVESNSTEPAIVVNSTPPPTPIDTIPLRPEDLEAPDLEV